MAQSSNESSSDNLTTSTQKCYEPEVGQGHFYHNYSVSSRAGDDADMQSSKARERRFLSDMTKEYHEANTPNQFDEAHETTAGSHALSCQHSSWGCVRCNSLPFLNSPFIPTEQFNSNQISNPNSNTQVDMQLTATPTGPARFPRQYTTQIMTSPTIQGNTATQYANMRSLEQQTSSMRASLTPSLSHSSTPQSIFSIPRTSPNVGQNPFDWATPATTVSFNFKTPNVNYAVVHHDQSELYDTPSKCSSKVSDEFDTHFMPYAGHEKQQWLQDAELDDLNYRRGSQGGAVQLQDHQVVDYMAAVNHNLIDDQEQLISQEHTQPTYGNSESTHSQQYLLLGQRTFNSIDLGFNDPFAPNNVADASYSQAAYLPMQSYETFDFNGPLYPNVNYPLPPAVVPSQVFTTPDDRQSHRGGPSRSRHNARKDEDLDRKLVEWRDAGMSYKEIMVKGNFGLEESTLRGRYRTLTKSKEKRLRKPIWDDHAVSALLEAVEHHAPAGSKGVYGKESLDKIPWKRVAEWMEKERKCYLYGNATVKKKYVEVIKARRLSRRQTTV